MSEPYGSAARIRWHSGTLTPSHALNGYPRAMSVPWSLPACRRSDSYQKCPRRSYVHASPDGLTDILLLRGAAPRKVPRQPCEQLLRRRLRHAKARQICVDDLLQWPARFPDVLGRLPQPPLERRCIQLGMKLEAVRRPELERLLQIPLCEREPDGPGHGLERISVPMGETRARRQLAEGGIQRRFRGQGQGKDAQLHSRLTSADLRARRGGEQLSAEADAKARTACGEPSLQKRQLVHQKGMSSRLVYSHRSAHGDHQRRRFIAPLDATKPQQQLKAPRAQRAFQESRPLHLFVNQDHRSSAHAPDMHRRGRFREASAAQVAENAKLVQLDASTAAR